MAQLSPDRRVRRTRQAIHQALITLMLEKGYEAVTVSEIIERADVGRSTFYSHFTDKQQVLYASLDDLGDFLRTHRDTSGEQLFGFSLPMFAHAHEQRHLLRALLGRRGGIPVQERVQHLLSGIVREELAARLPAGKPAVPLELVVTGVVGAYLALLARWLDENEPHTPRQMDGAFRRIVIPGVIAALRLSGGPPEGVPGGL